jgi:hypothetical protein
MKCGNEREDEEDIASRQRAKERRRDKREKIKQKTNRK